MHQLRLRDCTDRDIEDLVRLEAAIFSSDRISRRSFRYLLSRSTADLFVAESEGAIIGYAILLYRSGTSMARLYSIGVKPSHEGKSVGAALLAEAERRAYENDRILLRLEVRSDNERAIAFYRKNGYAPIGKYLDYYADHAEALRFEKILKGHAPLVSRVPYYAQTEDFTCGAACLMMALSTFKPDISMDPVVEIRLWRQATTIFMMSGPGGCEPFGIAVAAVEQGLKARLVTSRRGPLFLRTVRSEEKRRVMKLAQTDFRRRAAALGIVVEIRPLKIPELRREIASGGLAIVLVSGYRMFAKKVPHWILVHGDDGRHLLVHDPWVEENHSETAMDAANLPIPYRIFERMARFGGANLRAAVFISGSAS